MIHMKKNKFPKNKYNHSLKRQMTIVFVVTLALSILALWLINSLFLEKFYIKNKQASLMTVYNRIVAGVNNKELKTEDFELEMRRYASTYNVSLVILKQTRSRLEIVDIYSNEPSAEIVKEAEYYIMGIAGIDSVITKTDDLLVVTRTDMKTSFEYIEMWGVLSEELVFLMRTPVESIRESTEIANRFLLYVGLISMAVSGIIIYFITRSISKPILELASISERMADMDFDVKYNGKARNEVGLLGNNINRLSESLESTIGELKEANIELQKDNEQKTKIDEMRKEFISNVSHELKTPIALIQGYSEGLKEGINEEEERDYYCDVIMDEASRMNVMVKKLMTLNQLEFGYYEPSPVTFDILDLIRSNVSSAEILTKQAGIETTVPEGSCFVFADEFMIEEVLNNLLSNARNHCESEGQKRIDVSLEMQENRVRVGVFNTGRPIPDESLEHIWEKFYKVDKARTRAYGGSGVGLSIVKAIMDAHGQGYGVSNLDGGVLFWFTLQTAETKELF